MLKRTRDKLKKCMIMLNGNPNTKLNIVMKELISEILRDEKENVGFDIVTIPAAIEFHHIEKEIRNEIIFEDKE